MDPVLAQKQVDNILTGFIRVDPIGKAVYEANAAKFKQGLAALHERFQRALSTCRGKIFITNHAAFGYFAARYGLTQIGIAGLAPDAEPSAAKIRELIRVARQNDIQVIYYESLVSPRVAAAIAREVGARTLVFDPLEGLTDEELAEGRNYVWVRGQNLRNLMQGLDCPGRRFRPALTQKRCARTIRVPCAGNSRQTSEAMSRREVVAHRRASWQREAILRAMEVARRI